MSKRQMNAVLLNDYHARFIALKPRLKRPKYKFKDKEPLTPAEITEEYNNGSNFGLTANNQFLLIDLDQPDGHGGGSNGIELFKNFLVEHDISVESIFDDKTLMARTPTGGVHLVFKQRDPNNIIGQHLDLFGDKSNVDLKGSKNNFIVCAPSITDDGHYEWINEVDPIELPEALDIAIRQYVKKAKIDNATVISNGRVERDGMVFNSQFSNSEYVDVFYTIQHGFGPHGIRNKNLFRWVQTMRLITNFETTIAQAEMANANSEEPIDEDEMFKTIESAFAFEKPEIIKTAKERYNGNVYIRFLGEYEPLYIAVKQVDFMRNNDESDPTNYPHDKLVSLLRPLQQVPDTLAKKYSKLLENLPMIKD